MGNYSLEDIFELIEQNGEGVDLDMDISYLQEVVEFIEDRESKA